MMDRAFTKDKAQSYGLTGWVKNTDDDAVSGTLERVFLGIFGCSAMPPGGRRGARHPGESQEAIEGSQSRALSGPRGEGREVGDRDERCRELLRHDIMKG